MPDKSGGEFSATQPEPARTSKGLSMFPSNAVKELWQWILAAAVVVLMVLMHMQQGIAAEAKPQDAAPKLATQATLFLRVQ